MLSTESWNLCENKEKTTFVCYNKKKHTKQKTEVFSMDNFTTNNYEMKRDIINFSKKISDGCDKP